MLTPTPGAHLGAYESGERLALSLFGNRLELGDRLEVFDTPCCPFDLNETLEREAAALDVESGDNQRVGRTGRSMDRRRETTDEDEVRAGQRGTARRSPLSRRAARGIAQCMEAVDK